MRVPSAMTRVRAGRHHARIAVGRRLPPGKQQVSFKAFTDVGGGAGRVSDRQELSLGAERHARAQTA